MADEKNLLLAKVFFKLRQLNANKLVMAGHCPRINPPLPVSGQQLQIGVYSYIVTKVFYIILVLFFFTINSTLLAQVKFSAVCPNKQIGKNDLLQVQYIVENAGNVDDITPPAFKNFSVVSGPDQQSSRSDINGVVKQYISLEFVLKPTAAGNFTLLPATAKVNGKILHSNSLSIQVTNNSSRLTAGGAPVSPLGNMFAEVVPEPSLHQYDDYILHKGENLSEKIKRNLFVKVDVNKTSCYVGEPVVATYKLYTRLKSESNLTKSPSFNGFSVSEMEVPGNYITTTEKYNGREYSVYTLRKVQLYPLQPGNLELDPAEVENHITFIKAEYADARKDDIFYDMMRDFVDATTPPEGIEAQKITLQSKPLAIVVKPLPALNKPADYKGAIGSFTINTAVEKNNITTDEAANVTLTIAGKGNMQMINAPEVVWPDGLEAFDPKIIEKIDKTTVPLTGEKVFTYPFTVSNAGTYLIPSVRFCYFDVKAHDYKMLSTAPLTINVKKGPGTRASIPSQLSNVNSNKFINYKNKYPGFPWALSIAGVVIIAMLIWFTGKQARKKTGNISPAPVKNISSKKIEPTGKDEVLLVQNPLHEAEQALIENNVGSFYYTLNNCLRKYLAVKLNFPEKELGRKKLNELLDKHDVGIGTTLMLSSLMESIEVNLYAPLSSVNQLHEVYQKATEVVALLDKQVI